jgi:mevalonate kinase
MKNEITVSAPGKLMLFGEHAVVYGRPCIVTAVDQRINVTAEKSSSDKLIIIAPDVGVTGYQKDIISLGKGGEIPKGVKFIEFAVKNFEKKYGLSIGVKITTKSGFSSQYGFGSSSAVTVATLFALAGLFRVKLSKKALFDLSYETVIEIQGVGSGFDLAAAIWGGTIYFVAGGKKIVPLKSDKIPLVVGYTGVKADTATLIRKVADDFKKKPKEMEATFSAIGKIVEEAKVALLKRDFKRAGELMNLNQLLLESLGVNTQILSDLILGARNTGAYGAKLSGAGGGDCMIALVSKEDGRGVNKGITASGGIVIPVETGAEGVRIEK